MKLDAQEIREDIKTLFDFIRNLALCAAMLLSIPKINEFFPLVYGSDIPKQVLLLFVFGIFIAFYMYNLFWLFWGFKVKSFIKWKWVSYVNAFIMVSILTLVLIGYTFSEVWPVLVNI